MLVTIAPAKTKREKDQQSHYCEINRGSWEMQKVQLNSCKSFKEPGVRNTVRAVTQQSWCENGASSSKTPLRVSQLCVDLGLCSNVTTLICWLKSNPKVQCGVPLGCALGPSHLSPVSLKGPHQGRSILRAAGCPCCVCMGLWKAESHSLKQIQSLALGIELDATSSQERQTDNRMAQRLWT